MIMQLYHQRNNIYTIKLFAIIVEMDIYWHLLESSAMMVIQSMEMDVQISV